MAEPVAGLAPAGKAGGFQRVLVEVIDRAVDPGLHLRLKLHFGFGFGFGLRHGFTCGCGFFDWGALAAGAERQHQHERHFPHHRDRIIHRDTKHVQFARVRTPSLHSVAVRVRLATVGADDVFRVIPELPLLRIVFPHRPTAASLAELPDLLEPHFDAREPRFGLVDLRALDAASITALLRKQAAQMANEVVRRFGPLVAAEVCFAERVAIRGIYLAYSWLVAPASHPRRIFSTEEEARAYIGTLRSED